MSSDKDIIFILKALVLTIAGFCLLITIEIAIFKVIGLV